MEVKGPERVKKLCECYYRYEKDLSSRLRMREGTNNYNGSRRILVRFPVFADAVAADFEQRPRAQATLSPRRKYDAERLEKRAGSARATAGTGARRLISKSSIVLPLTKRPMRALRPTSQAKRAPNGIGWRISPH